MRERLRQISRRVMLKGSMAAGGALAVGVSTLAWLVEACSSGSGGSAGDPYGGYGYGIFGARSVKSGERLATRRGAGRIVGG